MICASIQHKSLEEIFTLLDNLEMAEIRLDKCPELGIEEIEELFSSSDVPLVATLRLSQSQDIKTAESKLLRAIEAGAKYLDLEIDAPAQISKRLRKACLESGTIMIRSFHDFKGTPTLEKLSETISLCRRLGGELIKIVTTDTDGTAWDTIRQLYGDDMEGQLIAFCMGEKGRGSRLECLKEGAPFTYAAISAEEATAPGQWTVEEMKAALYTEDRFIYHNEVLNLPSSKSFAQRAIIAAALSEGTSHLSGYTPCSDNIAAVSVALAIGASVTEHAESHSLEITGIGPDYDKLDIDTVFTGESGLLTRIMIPLLSLLGKKDVEIRGEGTLLNRPLVGANDIMAAYGVMLTNLEEHQGKEVFIPLKINGRLLPGRSEISGKGGSQLISGLLFALPLAQKDSTVYIQNPKSIPYMFISVDVLRKFGIKISNEMEGGEDFIETRDWNYCSAMTFKIRGGQKFKAADFTIEADWSSAAALMVAGAIFGRIRLGGLDSSSLQADLSILDILVEAGASVSQEESGEINVHKSPLNNFSLDLNNSPDLFPIVSVLAAFCPGESRLAGVNRLRNKESDRAEAISQTLTKFGVPVRIEGDYMFIRGKSLSRRIAEDDLLHGGEFSSFHDHRMAMALKVASLGTQGPITIDDTACLNKSYPDFLKDFQNHLTFQKLSS